MRTARCPSRCHPASIGFSAVPGVCRAVSDADDCGFAVELGAGGKPVMAPIAAGVLSRLEIRSAVELPLGARWGYTAREPTMIALDGERELRLCAGDRAEFAVERSGPWRLLPRKALLRAAESGLFEAE